jgi:hypothetical protein
LDGCIEAAETRTRLLDKITCFERVATILLNSDDPSQKERGANLQNKAQNLKARLKMIG